MNNFASTNIFSNLIYNFMKKIFTSIAFMGMLGLFNANAFDVTFDFESNTVSAITANVINTTDDSVTSSSEVSLTDPTVEFQGTLNQYLITPATGVTLSADNSSFTPANAPVTFTLINANNVGGFEAIDAQVGDLVVVYNASRASSDYEPQDVTVTIATGDDSGSTANTEYKIPLTFTLPSGISQTDLIAAMSFGAVELAADASSIDFTVGRMDADFNPSATESNLVITFAATDGVPNYNIGTVTAVNGSSNLVATLAGEGLPTGATVNVPFNATGVNVTFTLSGDVIVNFEFVSSYTSNVWEMMQIKNYNTGNELLILSDNLEYKYSDYTELVFSLNDENYEIANIEIIQDGEVLTSGGVPTSELPNQVAIYDPSTANSGYWQVNLYFNTLNDGLTFRVIVTEVGEVVPEGQKIPVTFDVPAEAEDLITSLSWLGETTTVTSVPEDYTISFPEGFKGNEGYLTINFKLDEEGYPVYDLTSISATVGTPEGKVSTIASFNSEMTDANVLVPMNATSLDVTITLSSEDEETEITVTINLYGEGDVYKYVTVINNNTEEPIVLTSNSFEVTYEEESLGLLLTTDNGYTVTDFRAPEDFAGLIFPQGENGLVIELYDNMVNNGAVIDIMIAEDGMTGISAIEAAGENVEIYNLQGVRVNNNNLPAGIYIINGKKHIVR